jgi:serine phosphatase RsbU (regulator of sigma subunit)
MAVPKILIVDDEPFNVDYLEQELEGLDCEIISATNGQDALDKIRFESPDLVLLDIMMPVMDGFTVLAQMKCNPATHDIPVIVISANNNLQSVVKGIQLGAEDYLPKPFEPVLLHARISSSLEKKRLRDMEQLYLKSLEREFEIARDIQSSFLPAQLPEVNGWEIAAFFEAARDVAGDFYDVFQLSNGNLVCVIGDVCGKGVGAALFMALFRSLIRSAFITDTDHFVIGDDIDTFTPGKLLQYVVEFVNTYVSKIHSDACMFSTIFIGIFNVQDGTLTYVNCGNEPPLVISEGVIVNVLSPTGPVVGIFPDLRFTVNKIVLAKDQMLLAFTDGVPDSLNEENVPFGTDRLFEIVGRGAMGSAATLKNIETQLHRFIGMADQFDDITILAVKQNS